MSLNLRIERLNIFELIKEGGLNILKAYGWVLVVLMLTSCSQVVVKNKKLRYIKTQGYGLIIGYDSLTLEM